MIQGVVYAAEVRQLGLDVAPGLNEHFLQQTGVSRIVLYQEHAYGRDAHFPSFAR